MATLEIRGLSKRYNGTVAVAGIDHVFAAGRITAIVGPSGSGKSTTLWMIAGLTDPDTGSVLLDGRDVTNVPAEKRDVGMVFQSYALFPHLTVRDNVAFGLKARGVAAKERIRRAEEILERVQMGELAARRIASLSGGEQQRVALARALAFRPKVLLLDEPLSALDAKLRDELRLELFRFLNDLAITTVYVTHDQAEALSLGHEVVVMRNGKVEQTGSPTEVYHRPATPFVARFLGSANLVPAEIVGSAPAAELRLPFAVIETAAGACGPCWAMLRPEDLEVVPEADADFLAHLESSYFLGAVRRAHLRVGAVELVADLANDLLIDPSVPLPLRIKREKVVVWPRAYALAPAEKPLPGSFESLGGTIPWASKAVH